jgi:carboxyl-terminal processing protease
MRRAGGFAAVALLVAGAFLLGFALTRTAEPVRIAAPAQEARDKPASLLEEVRSRLTHDYYRWIDPAILRERSVETMIARLNDPHTEYLTPAEFEALEDRTEGRYSGIGLTVGPADNGLVVTSAFEGPAFEAGIRKGDVILRIDGKPAGRMPFERSLALIKGEKGTIVRLTVRRPRAGTIEFQVVRQEIDVPAVEARLLRPQKGKLAYIRVLSFPEGTAERLARVTSRLVERGARGAIIDLRDNPGGLLDQAVATASVYLEQGIVCTTDGAHQEFRTYPVTGAPAEPDLPLVVLVNGGSASAAEIVAAALAENGRATLVGDRTFGKASVQSIQPLANGGALKLTTAKYLTPQGVDISEHAIRPKRKGLDDPLTRPDEGLAAARRALIQVISA